MKKIGQICLAVAGVSSFSAGAGQAEAFRPLDDFVFVYQPRSKTYMPSRSDNPDAGKSFEVGCTVAESGHMAECWAETDNIVDQNIVERAVDNVGRWIVAKRLRTGEPSAGMSFLVVTHVDERI